jgi:hypothetical protein
LILEIQCFVFNVHSFFQLTPNVFVHGLVALASTKLINKMPSGKIREDFRKYAKKKQLIMHGVRCCNFEF